MLTYGRASLARYPAFLDELHEDSGERISLDKGGTLLVASDRDETEGLRRIHDDRIQRSLPVQWIGASAALEMEPLLSPRITAAVHVPDDSQIDNRALVQALCRACETRGVKMRTGVEVTSLDIGW